MRVLVVTKDIITFKIYKPVVDMLRKRGHYVGIVAEGVSMKEWIQSGSLIFRGLPKDEATNLNTLERYDISPKTIISKVNPDVILTGLSGPIHLEEEFGLEANKLGIPLGCVEDYWGSHRRTKAVPNFICTIDDCGKFWILEYPRYDQTSVFVTGNPAMDCLNVVKPDKDLNKMLKNSRHIVLAVCQDSSTTPMLKGLLQALEKIGDYVLIPRFHPKWLIITQETINLEKDEIKKKRYESMLSDIREWHYLLSQAKNGDVLWVNRPDISIYQLILASQYTVSIFSNALIEAALLRRLPVSWMSDQGRESLQKAMAKSITSFPLVKSGCVIEVETPEEYCNLPSFGSNEYLDIQKRQNALLKCGDSAQRVVDSILRFLGGI